MPPAISDDEMDSDDGVDMVPAKAPPVKDVEDEVEDGDEESDGEEYRVEKIMKHDFSEEGVTLYQIKWLGYEMKSDLTWEPIDNLDNAVDIVKEYHSRIGGTPDYEAPKKKGAKAGSKRSSKAANLDSPQVTTSSKKAKRKSGAAATTPNGTTEINPKDLPEGLWEDFVRVSSILEEPAAALKDSKQKTGDVLLALLLWHSGRKTQHTLEVARRKCPQRLLDYYEQHLVFKPKSAEEEEADGAAEED